MCCPLPALHPRLPLHTQANGCRVLHARVQGRASTRPRSGRAGLTSGQLCRPKLRSSKTLLHELRGEAASQRHLCRLQRPAWEDHRRQGRLHGLCTPDRAAIVDPTRWIVVLYAARASGRCSRSTSDPHPRFLALGSLARRPIYLVCSLMAGSARSSRPAPPPPARTANLPAALRCCSPGVPLSATTKLYTKACTRNIWLYIKHSVQSHSRGAKEWARQKEVRSVQQLGRCDGEPRRAVVGKQAT